MDLNNLESMLLNSAPAADAHRHEWDAYWRAAQCVTDVAFLAKHIDQGRATREDVAAECVRFVSMVDSMVAIKNAIEKEDKSRVWHTIII